ncbi:MAG: OmpA family protein, partial [Polyangiaceae bacterium]|nr:OmpA family protein [Polyangiaceae bacterium]
MRISQTSSWLLSLVLVTAGASVMSGCKAELKVAMKTPEAPPPPADTDGDGIPDDTDACVTEAEDGNAPDPKDGCPNKDLDGDGIPIPTD